MTFFKESVIIHKEVRKEMKELALKQYHTEDFTYYKEVRLSFAQCTPEHNITLAELLRITSDMAGEDFDDRDMGWEFLQDKGLVFIVTRVSFHILKMPQYDTIIRLKTYEVAPQGPLCNRMFEIYDTKTDELLITAETLWTILDFKNQKLVAAKAYPYRQCPSTPMKFEGVKAGKINIPADIEVVAEHKILFSELDANGHTNNSKYINFAIDSLPEEFQRKPVKNLRLNYSKESHLGDTMVIKAKYIAEENKYVVQGLVNDAASFECELYY